MAVLPVITYPHPILKTVCQPVAAIDRELSALITDLVETLEAAPGCVGIAAPQVGVLKRVVVVDASRYRKPVENQGRMVLINPAIEWQEGEATAREGCLSLPHLTANVKRATQIRLTALGPQGNTLNVSASCFEARVILHEVDHLDGILFLDRVSSLKTDVFRRKTYAPGRGTAPA